ncbi:MAG: FAD-binding oxidoreductase, partial [Pseudomonadota bacterium]
MTALRVPQKSANLKPMTLPAEFIEAATGLLGDNGYSRDPEHLNAAATPWRGTYSGSTPFLAMPNSTEQVSALMKLCQQHKVCVTPQGGNTGLVDAGTPHGEITLSLRRMQTIRDVDPFNNSLTIEAGAPLIKAQQAAEDTNRLFPLSLGSEGTATIGGLISTNAGGVAVLRYGMMRDLLLGLEVVLANGEIWSGLSGLRKNNTGYDLKHVFAGAEGTLGIITAATLKLYPKTGRATAWITCPSARAVVELLALVRDHAGDTVTSFEIIPAEAVDLVVAGEATIRDPNPSNQPWRVLCEVSMPKEEQARVLLEDALAAAFEAELASDALVAENMRQAKDFWTIRETIPLSKRAYGTAINHDISVPISKIPEFLAAAEKRLSQAFPGATLIAFGHVGDGNLHYS